MKVFKSNFLILTTPIALNSLILPRFSVKLLLVQFLTMLFAEFARQWLWGEDSVQPSTPSQKRFFFFGVIYNNSNLERFFASKSLGTSQAQPKRIVVFAVTYAISFISTKYSAQFGGANPVHLFLISTIVSFWILCKIHAQLNRLLLLNLFINSVFFLNQGKTNFFPFFIWFVSHFFISFVSLKLETQKEAADKNIQNLFSFSDLKKSAMTTSILCLLFVIFNTIIPNYNKDIENEPTKSEDLSLTALSPGAQKVKLMKKTNISPEALAKMAKLKTDVENVKLDQLPLDFKNKSVSNPPSTNASTESSSEDLKYFSEQLKKDMPLTDEDLKKLKQLAKNVEYEAKQWQDSVTNSTAQNSSDEAFESYEKAAQKLNKEIQKSDLDKLTQETKDSKIVEPPNTPASTPKDADLIQEYTDAHNKIAKQVDQLMEQQQKQKQFKEELKILRSIDRLHQNGFKLTILIVLFIALIYILSIKGFAKLSQKNMPANQASLPSAVRRHLKDLYKALLKARLSPTEEVLKSYYLVELAMKEIDFPRSEDLPPQNYFEIVNTKFPFLGAPVKVATQLFNRVFYGEKTPSAQEIITLRSSLKDLLRKLQVIS